MLSAEEKDIQFLKGVGEKRARLFKKLGVPTVGALLRYYPRAYEDWSILCSIDGAPFDEPCCIQAKVLTPATEHRVRREMVLYKLTVSDGHSTMVVTFFNNRFAAEKMEAGREYKFYGKVGGTFNRREMVSPAFAPADGAPAVHPIYRRTGELSSRHIESAVSKAFELLPETLLDPLPDSLRTEQKLCHLRYALENIHFPKSMEDMENSRRRLVFEELLVLQLGLLQLKGREHKENTLRIEKDYSEEFYRLLPFSPTGAQRRAVAEGISDMTGNTVMSRLVQGDVGSGKTAVAAALCYSVIRSGMQAALMAPTEILARQHYDSMTKLLEKTGIHTALLTGSAGTKAKREIKAGLLSGEINFVVGTHALLSEGVGFHKLGLVVTDEQHRFGVAQRAALADKGDNPHLLVMSATPIPRTLALMIFGDLDVSILDELPPGRQKIDTFAVGSDKRERAFAFLRRHIDEGRQGYIVCPLVEEGENDLAAAQEYYANLSVHGFADYKIGLLHGRMKQADKDAVMSDFSSGKIDVLVATTVVEVGVDVPNACVMIVENAERFGLSQLHQLRGRVGRGQHKSYCILISDAQNEEALRRLKVMCLTNDGFRIADEDLKLRGPGDFFGARQHGLPEMKIADMASDMEVLKQAQDAAKKILAADPHLERSEHKGLKAETQQLFEQVGAFGLN